MSSFNALLFILQEIYKAQLEMIDLANKKRDILIKGNIDELSKIISYESSWIKKVGMLEEQRMNRMEHFSKELGQFNSTSTMNELIKQVKDSDEKNELIKLSNQLDTAIEDLKQLNELNTDLITQSLEFVTNSIELVGGGATEESYTYSRPAAQVAKVNANKVFFDKKA